MAATSLTYEGDPADNSAKVLRNQWQRYKELYTPVEDNLIASLNTDMTTPSVAETKKSNQQASEISDRMRQRYGMTEIAPDAANRQQNLANALAVDSAYNTASLAETDRQDQIRQKLVQTGQSILNQATGGLADATSMQTNREARNAQAEAAADAQDAQATSTMVSTGLMLAAAFF